MNPDLEKLRDIYIANTEGLTDEEREDNAQKIAEWERTLFENEALLTWKDHDITKAVASKAKQQYREMGLMLAQNRSLTERDRLSLWAKQDAMAWILSLSEADPRAEIERIHKEITLALDATN